MKKVFGFGLVLISLLTLFSCNPFSVDDDDDYAISAGQESSPVTGELQNNAETGSQNLQPQKALIQVVFNDGSSRTVLPSLYLKNFVLTGKRNGGAEQELAKAATKADWSGKSIEILTGDWEFTMSAEVADGSSVIDGVTVFKDTQAVSVGSGANVLSFVLKPFKSDGTEVSGGELSVTLSLDPEAKADKARAVLKASDGTEFTKDYPDSGKLSQGASITFQQTNLPAGTYDLEIEFYSENEKGGTIKQNSWMAIVRIAAGLKSSATVQNFNLNEVYKITGGYADASAGGLYTDGDVTLSEGVIITRNYAGACGGGIYNYSKTLTIESGVEISSNSENGNETEGGGGGIFNSSGTVIIKGGTIKTNSADHDGGAIYNEDGTCYIYGDTLIGKEVSVAPDNWTNGSNKAKA